MDAAPSGIVGQRIFSEGHIGTIKFYGEVPPSNGFWYGIEWDDASRGKHSGEHNGVKYFHCFRQGTGSFVREQKIQFGISDVEAFLKKYDELHDKKEVGEFEYFYNVGGNEKYESEVRLARLHHVNLRCTNISKADRDLTLGNIARNIVELDLSKTLLSDWQEVMKIVKSLPKLVSLDVSGNRISNLDHDVGIKLSTVKILQANKMDLNWQQILTIAACFDNLEELYACCNNIETLQNGNLDQIKHLRKLGLEDNPLNDWNDILLFGSLSNLQSLALSKTGFNQVYFPGDKPIFDSFLYLKTLILSGTMISSWDSVNQIDKLPALQVLTLQLCPLFQTISEYDARQEVIARISKCCQLNRSNVTVKERQIAERAFLKKYAKDWIGSGGKPDNIESDVDASFISRHPRYLSLLKTYDVPENIGQTSTTITSLKDNLVNITFTIDPDNHSITKKLPRSMTIFKLKGLLQRLFKMEASIQKLSYVDENGYRIELDDDLKAISYYSIVSGGTIIIAY